LQRGVEPIHVRLVEQGPEGGLALFDLGLAAAHEGDRQHDERHHEGQRDEAGLRAELELAEQPHPHGPRPVVREEAAARWCPPGGGWGDGVRVEIEGGRGPGGWAAWADRRVQKDFQASSPADVALLLAVKVARVVAGSVREGRLGGRAADSTRKVATACASDCA
jgi:hypothetical protein